jgi:uncharacterized LabA/DUF88 family protein
MDKQAVFLVDGFNLYHSLRQLGKICGKQVKCLDIRRRVDVNVSKVRSAYPGHRVAVKDIFYFSALATHLTTTDRGVVNRHRAYISALESTGVKVVLSKFKAKDVTCPQCHKEFTRHEEKETDVALGLSLVESFARGADAVVLVSGDSDLMPAIRCARRLFPHKKIGVAFPFNRRTTELAQAVDFSFQIQQKEVERSQFPAKVTLPDGTEIQKPASW